MNKKYKDRDWLYNEYVTKGKPMIQIGKEQDVWNTTIFNWINKFGIKSRGADYRANHIKLTPGLIEFLDGELLGDCCLSSRYNKSAHICYTSKHKKYLEWLSITFNEFGIEQTGKINKKTCKRWLREGTYDLYFYYSRYYRDLNQLYERWYLKDFSFCPCCEIIFNDKEINRNEWIDKKHCPACGEHILYKKTIPKDINLTPITLRQWYIGDGSNNGKTSGINLNTMAYLPDDVKFLYTKLKELGFECSIGKNRRLYIFLNYKRKFLDYIGSCPNEINGVYGYKWIRYV